MGWFWKWQWRARRRLWLRPTLNLRRSCLTRRPGFLSGTVQSNLRESCAVGLLPAEGAAKPMERIHPKIATAWVRQMHLSKGSVHSHLYLFNRLSHHSRAEFCWQWRMYVEEVTRLSKTQTRRLFTVWTLPLTRLFFKCWSNEGYLLIILIFWMWPRRWLTGRKDIFYHQTCTFVYTSTSTSPWVRAVLVNVCGRERWCDRLKSRWFGAVDTCPDWVCLYPLGCVNWMSLTSGIGGGRQEAGGGRGERREASVWAGWQLSLSQASLAWGGPQS